MPPKQHVMPRSASMIEKVGRLYDAFNSDDRVLIVIMADPDAIASSMALKRLLWRRVASVAVARTNVIKRPDNLALLQFMKMPCFHISEVVLGDYTRLVMVDSQPHHQESLVSLQFDVIIDHHPLGTYDRAKFIDVRPDYGATATMMTEYLRAAKIKPSRTLATALFYAIKTDTNNFVRQGQLEDMRAFRFLFPLINQNMISKIENSDINRASLKYFKTALQRVKLRKDTALVYLDKVDNPDTLVMLADFMMRIRDVNRSIAAGIFKDNLVVIFRVVGSRANAGQMASKALGAFGPAGGHKGMARAEIPLEHLDPKLFEKDGALERFLFNRLRGKGAGQKYIPAKA
jgi:nanoRNase/pAp phosphatase (c-di-AMP/oligoRNAs hydrolase)